MHLLVKLIPLFYIAATFGLSQILGGWARKYTSPNPFTINDIPDLSGKVAIVTGSNTGIGYESALEMARAGAHVIVAARNESKGRAAVALIIDEVGPGTKAQFLQLDLSSLQSVEKFASAFLDLNLPLNILINNAGVMMSPGFIYVGKRLDYGYGLTTDGFENHIGINHIAHFLLTQLLTPKLIESAPSRVVNVASSSEMFSYPEGIVYDNWRAKGSYEDGAAYGQSKLANILFSHELAKRLEGTGVASYSCHPGVIKSELPRYMHAELQMPSFLLKIFDSVLFETKDGALNQLYLATSKKLPANNGGYFVPIGTESKAQHRRGGDTQLSVELWEKTDAAIKEVRRVGERRRK